jgi:hypothetical protein
MKKRGYGYLSNQTLNSRNIQTNPINPIQPSTPKEISLL